MRRRQLVMCACTVAVTIAIAAAGMRGMTKNEVSPLDVEALSVAVEAKAGAQTINLGNGGTISADEYQNLFIVDYEDKIVEVTSVATNASANVQKTFLAVAKDDDVTDTDIAIKNAESKNQPKIDVAAAFITKETQLATEVSTNTTDEVSAQAAVVASADLGEVAPTESSLLSMDATMNAIAQSVENGEQIVPETEEAEEEETFSNLVIAQVNDYVNVRDIPSTDGEVVGKLFDDSVGTLVSETEDGWYEIKSGNVLGYVKAEYCVTGEEAEALVEEVGTRIATVNTDGLRVRTDATLDASVLGMVPLGEDLTVMEEKDGWVKISIEEGDGYVSGEYVELRTEFVAAESREEEQARLEKEAAERKKAQAAAREKAEANAKTTNTSTTVTPPVISGDSEMGVSVAQYACQFVGNPYVFGGSSLTNGTDCSGFVMSVYANFGVALPHSSTSDRSQGYAVDSIDNAQPGDLVCYSGHVALYIGNGQIVHASSKRTGIIISDAGYKRILAVRRIF